MNIQQKMKALLQNAIQMYKRDPSQGLQQLKQVERLQESLELTGEGLKHFKKYMAGIKAEIAFDRLVDGSVNEFAGLLKVYPMNILRNPNKIVLEYLWYGSSPQRVEEVRRSMWLYFKEHVLPYSKGEFKIGKPLKITPMSPKAKDQRDAWFRVEVPIS